MMENFGFFIISHFVYQLRVINQEFSGRVCGKVYPQVKLK